MRTRFILLTLGAFLSASAMAQGPAASPRAKSKAKGTPAATKSKAASTPALDKVKALRPPAGAKVAIVVFEDLQCPDCARAKPLLAEAQRKYNVPLVRRDFPLPMHNYAFQAAVIGRYFDTQSKELGGAWRDYVYKNQASLKPETIQARAQEFAQSQGKSLPFLVDPNGKLAQAVRADFQLGQRIGIQHTPTIFVVSNSKTAQPFVEIVDRSQLNRIIEETIKSAK